MRAAELCAQRFGTGKPENAPPPAVQSGDDQPESQRCHTEPGYQPAAGDHEDWLTVAHPLIRAKLDPLGKIPGQEKVPGQTQTGISLSLIDWIGETVPMNYTDIRHAIDCRL